MPRGPRKPSPTDVYHVMSRGMNKMMIYKDKHDRLKYMDILHRVKKQYNYQLYAFCLMGNHNHLLIKETDAEICKVMASINIRYSMYFNKKYSRVGGVFQERYRSQPIYSQEQLLACLRYIHNNPVKAGLVDAPGNYRWSSFHDYLSPAPSPLVCTDFILSIFGPRVFCAEAEAETEQEFLEYDSKSYDAEAAKRLVQGFLEQGYSLNLSGLSLISGARRQRIIARLRVELKLSYALLAQALGMNKSAVYRACQNARD